jgi:hypothetical protein
MQRGGGRKHDVLETGEALKGKGQTGHRYDDIFSVNQ